MPRVLTSDTMSYIDYIRNRSKTPLHSACENQDLELVKSLLKKGENPNAVDNEMFTPLHRACSWKSDETVTIIKLLLEHNANIEADENECGLTPLFTACLHKNDVAVKCLLKNHANPNAMDKLGCTPFTHLFLLESSIKIAQLLLQYNANIEVADWDGRTPFLKACYNCDYVATKLLLDNHANIFAVDNEGSTSLHLACRKKSNMTVTLIELLLQHHVNIEATNTEGWTPLMEACANDNLDAIKCLLYHHANIDAVDAKGQTPFMIACKNGYYNLMKFFLNHQANIKAGHSTVLTPFMLNYKSNNGNAIEPLSCFNVSKNWKNVHTRDFRIETPLFSACKNQNPNIIEKCLKKGENPNAVLSNMFTLLHLACTSKSDVTVTIIELLLQHNANIEADENECGWTPLFTACIYNNDVAVKCLLENHADPNATDKLGCTPFFYTVLLKGSTSILQLLLQYNANIEARNYNGRTPFLMACWNCNYVAAKFLLDNNANIFAVDNKGSTSLHLACQTKDNMTVPLIELLLQHHANIEAVDKKGWTPLMVASNRSNCNAIKCLFNHYANVNHSDINNSTALHIAIERQSMETTECLIKCNADINLLDKENQTPLEKALKMESPRFYDSSEIVRILIFEVAKLKVAGFKIHDNNLDILHNHNVRWPLLIDESRYTDEIEQMKKKNIGNSDITLYDFLKNDIRFLFQFVTDKEIQQQLKQEDLDKQFPSYINIIRNRFREATIQCTRNELINQAK